MNKGKKQINVAILLLGFFTPGLAVAQVQDDLLDFGLPSADDKNYYDESTLIDITDEGAYDADGDLISTVQTNSRADLLESSQNSGSPALPGTSTGSDSTNSAAFESYKDSLIDSWGGKKAFTQVRLSDAKENLEDQQQRFEVLEDKIQDTEEKLIPIAEEINSLEVQIERLDGQVRLTKEKIINVELLIAEKMIEIKESLKDLEKAELELKIQEQVVLDFIKLLYGEQSKYLDIEGKEASSLKLLLEEGTISESLMGEEYVAVMEETGRAIFHELEEKRRALEAHQLKLLKDQEDLDYLYVQLNNEKRILEESRVNKEQLLEQTQGEEQKYQLLLEESKREQLESAIAVQSLQENIQMIETALDALDKNLKGATQAENVGDLTLSSEALEILSEDDLPDGQKPFIWPVPQNVITATFRDPSYPYSFEHNAIDIRAQQFTEIHAPADAYVSEVADNGYGYSYLVLAHKNNLVTVYGHVSEFLVEPGMTVRQGDVVALSGGTPGTLGAGSYTTGAHLHFEVWKNGAAVNPQLYLRGSEEVEIDEEAHTHSHEE